MTIPRKTTTFATFVTLDYFQWRRADVLARSNTREKEESRSNTPRGGDRTAAKGILSAITRGSVTFRTKVIKVVILHLSSRARRESPTFGFLHNNRAQGCIWLNTPGGYPNTLRFRLLRHIPSRSLLPTNGDHFEQSYLFWEGYPDQGRRSEPRTSFFSHWCRPVTALLLLPACGCGGVPWAEYTTRARYTRYTHSARTTRYRHPVSTDVTLLSTDAYTCSWSRFPPAPGPGFLCPSPVQASSARHQSRLPRLDQASQGCPRFPMVPQRCPS